MAKFNKDAQNRPIQKIYKRIGLRRDQNFADLTSPTNALENLLDKLIDDTGNTFLASDLKEGRSSTSNPASIKQIQPNTFS